MEIWRNVQGNINLRERGEVIIECKQLEKVMTG